MRVPYTIAGLGTVLVAAVLASCGGGGHAVVPANATFPGALMSSAPSQASKQSVTIIIKIPGRSAASSRRPAYISQATQSATITATALTVSATPTPIPSTLPGPLPVTASTSVNCAATCTATLSVPVGMVQFTITLYDQPTPAPSGAPTPTAAPSGVMTPVPPPAPGPSSALSTGTVTALIAQSPTATNLLISFSGVPATVQLTPQVASLPAGSPTNIPVLMNVLDADGYIIAVTPPVAAGTPVPFSAPYSFAVGSTPPPNSAATPTPAASPALTLAPDTVASPGATLSLQYAGSSAISGLQYLYSRNAAVNGGAWQTAGTIFIGSAPTPYPSSSPTAPAIPTSSPAAALFPVYIVNNSGIPGAVNVYVYGNGNTAGNAGQQLVNLTSATTGATIPASTLLPIMLPSAGGEVDLPPLCSARMYVTLGGGTLNIAVNASGGIVNPAPWSANDPAKSTNTIFDLMEYTWQINSAPGCPATSMFFDVSSVDFLGIPMSLQLQTSAGAVPSLTYGVQPGTGTRVAAALNTLGAPWSSLVQTFPGGKRIMNPAHAIGGVFNFPPNYLASYMKAICNQYPAGGSTDLVLGGYASPAPGSSAAPASLIPGLPVPTVSPGETPAPYPYVYGRYSGSCGNSDQVLTFYSKPNMTGQIVASFAGVPSSADAFGNAGYFAANAPSPGQTPSPATLIGRILSVSILRGTVAPTPTPPPGFQTAPPVPIPASQPVCNANAFYGGVLTNYGASPQAWFTTDWYAALLHANAFSNGVYAFADDDECGVYSSTINPTPPGGGPYPPPGYRFVVTLEPF